MPPCGVSCIYSNTTRPKRGRAEQQRITLGCQNELQKEVKTMNAKTFFRLVGLFKGTAKKERELRVKRILKKYAKKQRAATNGN